MDALRGHFRPEFLNRIDEIVIFDRLSDEDLSPIVEIQVAPPGQAPRRAKAHLELTDDAKLKLARDGYDPVYGARPLKRAIQREILDPLSLELLGGRFHEGDTIHADTSNGKIVFNK